MRDNGMTVAGKPTVTELSNKNDDDKNELMVAFNPLKDISVFWNNVTNPATNVDSNTSGGSSSFRA